MLRAVGFSDDDFSKPQVGIASTWSQVTPCNSHLAELADRASAGADAAGGKGVIFNTITISDGIANGTEGMKYSLVSREVIADSIETVAGCEGFDGLVALGGCDKNMPGCLMGLARLNRPSVFVYGGTIMPGADHTDLVSVFEAMGAHSRGDLDLIDVKRIEETAIPGPGCGGMYTANTMASAIEALGMSLPGSSAQNAVSDEKRADSHAAGEAVLNLLEHDIKPSDIMTREAFENAITVVIALGGSTNAVLHLIAMADTIGVPLGLDDFTAIGAVCRCLPTCVPVALHDERVGRHRRYPAADEDPARCRPAAWRLPDGDGADPGREPGRCGALSRANRSSPPSMHRSRTRAICASSTAIWRRRELWPRSPARKAPGSPARRGYSAPRSRPRRASTTVAWWPAMSWSSVTKGRVAGRACARC